MLYINGFSDYYDNILRNMLPDEEKFIIQRPKYDGDELNNYKYNREKNGSFVMKEKYQLPFDIYLKYHINKFSILNSPSIFILGFYGHYISYENKTKKEYPELVQWAKTLDIPSETFLIEIHQYIRIYVDISLRNLQLESVLPPNEAAYIVREYLLKKTFPEPNIQQVSDDIMAKQKGFDHKYSFRKEPTKRKQSANNNK